MGVLSSMASFKFFLVCFGGNSCFATVTTSAGHSSHRICQLPKVKGCSNDGENNGVTQD